MLDRYLGVAIIVLAMGSYLLADMPLFQSLLGETFTLQAEYMKANIYMLIPLALFLIYWRSKGLHPYSIGSVGILAIIVGVVIYLLTTGGLGL